MEIDCAICRGPVETSETISALGTRPICFECFFANAELPATIHNALLDARRSGRPIPREIVAKMTIYAGEDGYLSLRAWERRVSRQALIKFDPEEEALINEMLAKIRTIKMHRPRSLVVKPRRTWWRRIADFFVVWKASYG